MQDVFDKPLAIPTLSVKRIKTDDSELNSSSSINTSLFGQYWDLLRQYIYNILLFAIIDFHYVNFVVHIFTAKIVVSQDVFI